MVGVFFFTNEEKKKNGEPLEWREILVYGNEQDTIKAQSAPFILLQIQCLWDVRSTSVLWITRLQNAPFGNFVTGSTSGSKSHPRKL